MSLSRVEVTAVQEHQRFEVGVKDFSKQYSHLYSIRSEKMKEGLRGLVRKQWGENLPLAERIIDTEANLEGLKSETALVGVLYKDMGLRASVLDEFKESGGISMGNAEKVENYVSQDDMLILEDESGRVAIDGELASRVNQLVTGIMVALQGSMGNDGKFHASEMLTLGLSGTNPVKLSRAPSPAAATAAVSPDPQGKFVMLVSGLSVGGGNAKASLQLQLLMDFLSGRVGSANDSALASRIARVVVCGNSVLSPDQLHGAAGREPQSWSHAATKASAAKLAQENIAPIRELDSLLAQALMTVPIDVMPGNDDPGTFTLPQQPLHPCLLPQASRYSSLSLVTNPYHVVLDGISLLGHSGAPVADIARQTQPTDDAMQVAEGEGDEAARARKQARHQLEILHNTVRWGHLAPTAPDSLPCHPFVDEDPFILSHTAMPHLVFSGNAAAFATEMGTTLDGHAYRVLCVPSFSQTGTAVLVDLASLDVSTIEFGLH